jgi:succinate-acetate transporter protein
MTTTGSAGAPEGVAQDVEAPVAEQATVGPLTGDPAIVGVPTFVGGSVMLGLALINYAPAAGGALPIIIIIIGVLTLGSLRLPSAFTLIFALIEVALILVLASTANGSSGLAKAGGIVVFAFAAVGAYVFAGSLSVATGGKPFPLGRPVLHG